MNVFCFEQSKFIIKIQLSENFPSTLDGMERKIKILIFERFVNVFSDVMSCTRILATGEA